MVMKKLTEFLDYNNAPYVIISHFPAYTSQETAGIARIPGKEMAKTVLVLLDGKLAMAVLSASSRIDFNRLKEITGKDAVLADEDEFRDRFPESEIGAMPPFGNLWNMEVMVSETIAEEEEIAFKAGSHHELIMMMYVDFERLVRPQVLSFSCKTHPSKEEMRQGMACS
jgi:Ala-tRNA(Pro) deacylase